MSADFEVTGQSATAPFTLKVHRGEGMALLAMDWKAGMPPRDFVGFAIEYREPGGDRFFPLRNRLSFPRAGGSANPIQRPTTLSPIQKFRWVHFPRNADLSGEFLYKVTPVFMNDEDELSYGDAQQVAIELRRETYPGQLNVTFTRGFVSSQAFVDRYEPAGPISSLLPAKADVGLSFRPTHPDAADALRWMGFEARSAIIEVLDQAIADTKAQVRVVAYDLNEPDVVSRLEKLRGRLKVIIDDDGAHGEARSSETEAEHRLVASAGSENVKRQHMGKLQHNKTIVVDGPSVQAVVCGSTNFSWRGFFVQANNAVVLRGQAAVERFQAAFAGYWSNDQPAGFGATAAAQLTDLGLPDIDARVAFSPHTKENALLKTIADDIATGTTSSLFYSLAFLYQTPGPVRDAIEKVTADDDIFVYGVSDRRVSGGVDLQRPAGDVVSVFPPHSGRAFRSRSSPSPQEAAATGCTTSSPWSISTSRRPGSEMDARVKGALGFGVVGGHGGGCWWGRAAGASATTTVTLRCAGRDRRTVSGRELPRTNVASRNRIDPSEDPPGGSHRAARPHQREKRLLGGDLLGLLGGGRRRCGGVGGAERLVGHRGPQESDQLACDSDVRDCRAFPLLGQVSVAVVEPDLCLPGALVGLGAGGWAARSVTVVPGGLDQQPAGVTVTCERDVPAMLLITGGVLRRGDPEPGRQLARVPEAVKVADLGDQPERGQRADAAEPRQDLNLPRPPLTGRDLLQASVERRQLPFDPVEVDQELLERLVSERIIEALAREPRAVELGPGGLALAEDPAVTQQLLEHPIAGRHPRAPHIIARPEQIPEPLQLGRRRVHEPQQAGAVQAHELLRVATVGLDAVSRADRDQRRRDHVTRHAELREQPPQREPAGPGLVADREPSRAAELVDEPADRSLGRLYPADLRLAAIRRQHRGHDRELVLIDRDPPANIAGVQARGNVRHGWSSTVVCGSGPCGPSTTPHCSTRERCDARGPASCVHTDYLGSYNFSAPADTKNGENLLLIKDRRIAVAYAVEALRIFDHYHFRVAQREAAVAARPLVLARPPRGPGETPWWDEYYTDVQKVRDREIFA